jgi:nucleoside-diphosphate-sugar epimerase
MKVLITGHDGYIGSVLAPVLAQRGHEITGLDTLYYSGCGFDTGSVGPARDVRDAVAADVAGHDAVVHLAALSNDPLGELDPDLTYDINHRASVMLAAACKQAGVRRFVFASSCSLYGTADTAIALDESAPFNPVTPYGRSKVLAEGDIKQLADDDFSPTFLRNATVYGVSARHRGDLVVNNLAAYAYCTGKLLLMSDGSPWRPLIHVRDLAAVVAEVVEGPIDHVHNQAFNVGSNEHNYQIRDIAEIVASVADNSPITFADDAGPDVRSYRVDFSKLHSTFPALRFDWDIERGAKELLEAYSANNLTLEEFLGPRFTRLKRINELLEHGDLDAHLRWTRAA